VFEQEGTKVHRLGQCSGSLDESLYRGAVSLALSLDTRGIKSP
jgi:hypothetical protein